MRFKTFIHCSLLILLASCSSKAYLFTSFHEPANEGLRMLYSYDGRNWTDLDTVLLQPKVGNQKVMRDPSIVQGPDGTFHLVWTSSWRGDLGFGYASSKDLFNWREQQFIPVMKNEPTTVNTWAPELFYDDEQKQYIIIWASCIPGRFERGIEEDSNNHRMYVTTTPDFKTFTGTKLFIDPKFSVIDAVIVKRKKDDYVLVLKDNTRPERNIKVAFGTTALGPWTNISKPFSDNFTEGPAVVKIRDEWLIYYDSYRKKIYEAVATKDFVKFENVTTQVKVPEGHKHGTIVPVKKKVIKAVIKEQTVKMKLILKYILISSAIFFALLGDGGLIAQDTVRYIGTTLSNVDYHHGQLSPAVGVHNIQTMRANRSDTGAASWTYNHAPMLAYWNNTFYLEYLSDPVGEHIPPGQTLLQTSKDGYNWTYPIIIFPPYKIPDGFVKEGKTDTAKNSYAVMHQRFGFYTSKSKRLFALAFYGIALGQKDDPNDGNGVGRVIREIKTDGSFGPIYFLRCNHSFNEKNTNYPFYKSSKDKGFVAACDEILNTPLLMMQTVEEGDRNDPLIPLQKDFKAFNYYHLHNGNVVGLWKSALTSISKDEGKTWQYNPTRAPGFVNSNAKIWGQRTSDGKYATVYNPSEFRWPLAVSVSDDGLKYKNLLLVNGEITSMRYGGAYKSYGPQYVRGIQEMDGKPADNNMWVTYSMNKEDMWVSRVPVPVKNIVTAHVNDLFNNMPAGKELNEWNIYSPLWCRVNVETVSNQKVIALHDSDPFDYAKAERIFPESKQLVVEFTISAQQTNTGNLEIELLDKMGTATLRLMLDSTGSILTKQGYRNKSLGKYNAGEHLNIKIELNTTTRFYTVTINNGRPNLNLFFQPVESVERLLFRTGEVRRFPNADTPTDQDYDLPNANSRSKEAVYFIHSVKTK